MTRIKTSEPSDPSDPAGTRSEHKENGGVVGVQKKNAKKKLSREALALMNASSVIAHTNIAVKALAPPKGRPSAPGDGRSPGGSPVEKAINRGKKGMSAPPLPDGDLPQSLSQQQQQQPVEARSKRAEVAKCPAEAEVHPQTAAGPEPEPKRPKADLSSDRQQQRIGKVEKPPQRPHPKDGATEAEADIGQTGMSLADGMGGPGPSQPPAGRHPDKKAARQIKGSSREGHGQQAPGLQSHGVPIASGAAAGAADAVTSTQPAPDAAAPKRVRASKCTTALPLQPYDAPPAEPCPQPARKDAAHVDGGFNAPMQRVESVKEPSKQSGQDGAMSKNAGPPRRPAPETTIAELPPQAATNWQAASAQQQPVPAARAGPCGAAGKPAEPRSLAAAGPAVPAAEPRQQGPRQGSIPAGSVHAGVPPKRTQPAPSGTTAPGDGAAGLSGMENTRNNSTAADGLAGTPFGTRTRPFPPTGTTPVRAFIPVPSEVIGQHERAAAVDLQNQLNEVRALYDDLKATKIQELEKIFAEHAESADEEVREANKRAALWQAAAERAEQKLKAMGVQEFANKIKDMEEHIDRLLLEKAEVVRLLAQREKELARLQQETHDLRAQVWQTQKAPDFPSGGVEEEGPDEGDAVKVACPKDKQAAEPVSTEAGGGSSASDLEAAAMSPEVRAPALREAVATRPSDAAPLQVADAVVVQHLPTPPPALGVPFPTPAVQLTRRQSLLDGAFTVPESGIHSVKGGVYTACQRVVQMLPSLRAPTPSTASRLAAGLARPAGGDVATNYPQGPAGPVRTASGKSDEVGVSTECQRIVQMLPSLSSPSPSIQSHQAPCAAPPGTVVAATGAAAAGGTPPHAADGPQGQLAGAALGSKGRRSEGSPIDGICGTEQRKANITTTHPSDMSFTHGMGAPEAFSLGLPLVQHPKEQQYSFVDLNPASAQKAPSAQKGAPRVLQSLPLPAPDPVTAAHALHNEAQLDVSVNGPCFATHFAKAAATALPLSPERPTRIHTGALATFQQGASPGRVASGVAAPINNTGSVASNQLSCTGPTGLVARAMAQQQLQQREELVVRASPIGGARLPLPIQRNPEDGIGKMAPGGGTSLPEMVLQAPSLAPSAGGGIVAAATASGQVVTVPQPTMMASTQGGTGKPPATPGLSDPAALNAKADELERYLSWRANVLSLKPMHVRLTHASSGICVELEEIEPGEDELATTASGGDQPQTATDQCPYLMYSPVELCGLAGRLPEYYQDVFSFPKHQEDIMLEELHRAIQEATKS